MKNWGSICLICLILSACASEKKMAPVEGRLSLDEQTQLQSSTDKQTLDQPQILKNALSVNAQNKQPHYAIKETKNHWHTSAGSATDQKQLSNLIVGNNNIFVLDHDFNLRTFNLNGKESVQKNLAPKESGIGLTFYKNKIFALGQRGTLVATDTNEKVLWKIDLDAPFRNDPIIYRDILYVLSTTNGLWAIDTSNGKELWHYQTSNPTTALWGMGKPVVNNNIIVVAFSNGTVNAFHAQTGAFLWENDMIGQKSFNQIEQINQTIASPIAEDDVVYLTGNAHITKALNIKTGEEIWSNTLASVTTPIISGNSLFILDKNATLHALNKKSGKQFWQVALTLDNGVNDLALINHKVVVFNENQTIVVDAKSGKILKNFMGEKKASRPAITHNGIYFLTQDSDLYYQGSIQ